MQGFALIEVGHRTAPDQHGRDVASVVGTNTLTTGLDRTKANNLGVFERAYTKIRYQNGKGGIQKMFKGARFYTHSHTHTHTLPLCEIRPICISTAWILVLQGGVPIHHTPLLNGETLKSNWMETGIHEELGASSHFLIQHLDGVRL